MCSSYGPARATPKVCLKTTQGCGCCRLPYLCLPCLPGQVTAEVREALDLAHAVLSNGGLTFDQAVSMMNDPESKLDLALIISARALTSFAIR